jgi:hypothetical protein
MTHGGMSLWGNSGNWRSYATTGAFFIGDINTFVALRPLALLVASLSGTRTR